MTCTPPGGEPIELSVTSGSVAKSLGTGTRFTASLSIAPKPDQRCFATVTTPGAIFSVETGWSYGAGPPEWIPLGQYVLARNAHPLRGEISLDLTDRWQRLEQARFLAPYSPAAGPRAEVIRTMVQAAIAGVAVSTRADGGTYQGGSTWDRSRTDAIVDLARDGAITGGFTADGTFAMTADPVVEPGSVAWTFVESAAATERNAENVNVISLERSIPFDRLYNTVVVVPVDESQTWTPQRATVADITHPRHPSKIGVIPYFYSSPTISSATQAARVARTMLARVVNESHPLSIESYNLAHLEPGDTVSVITGDDDPRSSWLVESVSFDLMTGATSLTCRSSILPEIEESA